MKNKYVLIKCENREISLVCVCNKPSTARYKLHDELYDVLVKKGYTQEEIQAGSPDLDYELNTAEGTAYITTNNENYDWKIITVEI